MFRDSLAIEKCRLESILWARRIAGGGPDHIFYESDNEGFIVRCITDLHERRDRARASGLCSCGAERAPGYRLCPVCHGRERDRQRRQVATSIAVGQCVRNGCVTAAEPGRRKCRRHLDEHAEQQQRAAAVRGLGRITADSVNRCRGRTWLSRGREFDAGAVRRPQPASLERLDDATGALVGVVRGRIIVAFSKLSLRDCRRPGLGRAAS